jgi:hypothetical protein
MPTESSFVIRNDCSTPLLINVEPEGVFVPLRQGEQVCVKDRFFHEPVTLRISSSGNGANIISVWPGDGDVCVEKEGVDVLESLANGVGAIEPR